MTTIVKPLTQFDELIEKFIDATEDPDEYYVLIGDFAGRYSVSAPEAPHDLPQDPEELPEDFSFEEAANDLFQIGCMGWSGEIFGEESDPVAEYMNSDTMSTYFLQTLVVHESVLDRDKLRELEDDWREAEA